MFSQTEYPLWLAGVLSGAASMIIIFLLSDVAENIRLIDKPDARKLHCSDVPVVGGIAIYIVSCFALIILGSANTAFWIVISATTLVATGALDDAFRLGIKIRLISQVICTLVIIGGTGLSIRTLNLDLSMLNNLPFAVSVGATIICVIGLTNAFNMIDGIDGLAAGQTLISISSIMACSFFTSSYVLHLDLLIVLLSSVLAFFLINLSITPLRPVFLGDAGSLLLGSIVAWMLIYYSQPPVELLHPAAVLWCVTIPVADTVVVIFRRMFKRQSPFTADRSHLHYMLIDYGLSSRETLILILCGSCCLNLVGLVATYLLSPIIGIFLFCTVILALAGIINAIQRCDSG